MTQSNPAHAPWLHFMLTYCRLFSKRSCHVYRFLVKIKMFLMFYCVQQILKAIWRLQKNLCQRSTYFWIHLCTIHAHTLILYKKDKNITSGRWAPSLTWENSSNQKTHMIIKYMYWLREKNHEFNSSSFEQTWIHFNQECIVLNWVEISPVVLEKISFEFCQYIFAIS